MALDIHCTLEVHQSDRWVFLCDFTMPRMPELFERMGFDADRINHHEDPMTDWSPMSRLVFNQDIGIQRGCLSLSDFRTAALAFRASNPTRYDLRPSWRDPFAEWAEKELQSPFWLAWFLSEATPADLTEIGTNFRICYWFH
ncbi:MAG TPA: hypothetical protein VK157_11195 [Phycisphaerales bacterium]|nr:hypothetical protein [Phycisphaerales bacterium]